jgi:putative ABC transport system permease protein
MLNFLLETFRLGLKNLRLHKLRSLLTALGIILGVAGVIIMWAIGAGAKQAAQEQMRQLGATNILLRSTPPPESSEASQRTERTLEYGLKREDLDRLALLPKLTSIVPLRNTEQKITRGGIRAGTLNAVATVPQAVDVIQLRLSRGRFFNQVDYDQRATVCVLGANMARQMFPYQDPLGQSVLVGTAGRSSIPLVVIGVLEPTGLRAGSEGAAMVQLDPDKCLYFPLTVAQAQFGDAIILVQSGGIQRKDIELSEIWLKVDNVEDVERVAAEAEHVLQVGHAGKVDYEVKAPIQILRNAEKLNRTFNFVMGGIAAFSLVVGGIGIMNIMLATVTERTREIGIRRALGAKRRHITLQFLIETTVISVTGGLIGIALGTGTAKLLPIVVRWLGSSDYPTAITSGSVIGSFIISGAIGIGFGLYPAIIAARMNPIEALRHE